MNYSEMSNEELLSLYKTLVDEYVVLDGRQMSIKLAINSMYGVFANKYFAFFSYAIAESIPGQGRHITKSTIKQIDRYFTELWPDDTKVHQAMGLTEVIPIKNPVVVYSDTDSVYYDLSEVYKNTKGWKDQRDVDYGGTKFALAIFNNRLEKYLNNFFGTYSKKFGTPNFLNLEMEKIARAGVFLAKKKYALDISWKAGDLFYDKGSKIEMVGGEVVSGSTPKYTKAKLREMVIWMLDQDNSKFPMDVLVNKLNAFKAEYKLKPIDEIAKAVKITDYEKYVIADNKTLELKKGIPYHIRAGSYYNHILNTKYSKFKSKYPLIRSGDKIKYYKALINDKEFDTFGYLPNSYPYEFAPDIDIEEQFSDSFLIPLNRYVVAMGQNEISKNFFVKTSLF